MVSPPDTLGRVVFTLTPGAGANSTTPLPQFALAGYIVDANHIELVETGLDALNGTLGGTASAREQTPESSIPLSSRETGMWSA
ncbi:MAG: hypothetical protein WB762_04650 [Candidatus Sulfotelmatobacter sp.]